MIHELYNLSNLFQWAGSAAIAVCCLLHFNKRHRIIKTLGLYGVASFLFAFAQKITIWAKVNYVNQIANISVLVEAWFFSLLFYWALKNTSLKKIVLGLVVFYSIFYVITFLFFVEQSISFVRFGRDILMITLALSYFYYLIRRLPEENLLKFPMFWISASVLFYFCGIFFSSLTSDYIVSVLNNDRAGLLTFRNFFRFGFCLVLVYAGWLEFKSLKSSPVNS